MSKPRWFTLLTLTTISHTARGRRARANPVMLRTPLLIELLIAHNGLAPVRSRDFPIAHNGLAPVRS